MRFFFKLILLTLFGLPLILAVDTKPTVNHAAEITPSSIERAKRILSVDATLVEQAPLRGLSFNDIAADRAGVRFGESATKSATAKKLPTTVGPASL